MAVEKQEIAVDLLINGLDRLNQLTAGLRALRDAARGVNQASGSLDRLGASSARAGQATDRTAANFAKAEAAAIRLASAEARLQVVNGNFARAEQVLADALSRVNRETVQAVQLETQLARVRQRIANQPRGIADRLASPVGREAAESLTQGGFALQQFITAPLAGLAAAAVESFRTLDQGRQVLREARIEAGEVDRIIKGFQQNRPILATVGDAARLVGQFKSVNLSADLSVRTVRALDIQTVKAGGSAEDLKGAVTALVQILGKGKLTAEELNQQLFERLPSLRPLIQQAFGTASAEALVKLGVTGQQFIERLTAAVEAGGAPVLTLGQKFDQLKARALEALAPIGVRLLEVIIPVIERAVPLIETLTGAFAKLPGPIQLVVLALGGFAAAAGPVLGLLGGLVQTFQLLTIARLLQTAAGIGAVAEGAATAGVAASGLTVALRGAAAASLAFAATPTGLVVLGIAAALGVAALAWSQYETAAEKAQKAAAAAPETASNLQAINANIAALQERTVTAEALNRAIGLLDPAEQQYIRTLRTQEEQIARTTAALNKKKEVDERLAAIQRAEILPALLASYEAYEQQKRGLDSLGKQYDQAKSNAEKYAQSQEVIATGQRTFATEGKFYGEQFAEISRLYKEAGAESGKLSTETKNLAAGFIQTFGSAEKAKAGIDQLTQSKAISTSNAEKLKSAIVLLEADVRNAGNTAQVAAQQVFNLSSALSQSGIAGARSALAKQIEQAVIAARASSGNLANNAVKSLGDGITKDVAELRRLEKAVQEIEKRVGLRQPQAAAPRRATSRAAAPEEFRETIRIAESEFRIKQALAQREIARAQEREQTQTSLLREQLDERRISIAEYYDAVAELQRASSEAQIAAVEQEVTRIGSEIVRIRIDALNALARLREERASALAAAKAAQKPEVARRFDRAESSIETKAKTEVNELVAKQIELETRLGTLRGKAVSDEAKLNSERGKALRVLGQQFDAISRVIQASIGSGFEAEVEQRLGGIQETIRAIEAETRAEIEERQALVARGLLSEIAARQIIFGLEQKGSAEIQAQLEAAARLIRLLPDSERKRQLQAENQLGQTENRTRTISPQEALTADLRRGLTSDLTSAFEDFISNAEFSLDGLRDFALGVVGSIRRALGRIVGDFVERRIVQPLVDKLLGDVLGLGKVDPATVANTAATTANTTALTGLTAAITTGSLAAAGGFGLTLPDNLAEIAGLGGGRVNDFGQPADVGSLLGDQSSDQTVSPVRSVLDKIGGSIKGFADKLGGVVGKIGGGLRNILSSIFSFAGSIFGSIFGGGAKAAGGATAAFSEGGYTGDGPASQPAGIVHAGEFVQPANVVQRWGAGFFEGIRTGAITPADISARVNARMLAAVAPRNPSFGFMAGGLVGASGGGGRGTDVNINNVIVDDRRNALASLVTPEGIRTFVTMIGRNRAAFNAALGGA